MWIRRAGKWKNEQSRESTGELLSFLFTIWTNPNKVTAINGRFVAFAVHFPKVTRTFPFIYRKPPSTSEYLREPKTCRLKSSTRRNEHLISLHIVNTTINMKNEQPITVGEKCRISPTKVVVNLKTKGLQIQTFAVRFHSWSCVDRITKQTITRHGVTNHASNTRTCHKERYKESLSKQIHIR